MSTINFSPQQRTVQDLINLYEKGCLNLQPGFQRSSVWKERDRAKLIDSLLRNYPLPSIFLHRRPVDGHLVYDVIDGKQRIESILMFTGAIRGNRFQAKTQLPDSETEEQINWVTLKRKKLQHLINGYNLQTIEVTGDLDRIIELFVRINSTGRALTGAETRHAKFYNSEFLRKAGRLAERHKEYFRANGIISASQLSRMKHVELICELMVAAYTEDVTNKKAALDKVMDSHAVVGRRLEKVAQATVSGLNKVKRIFPELRQTRFRQISDFYTLAVLVQKFEREGLVLLDGKRNRLATDLLAAFSIGVDAVSLRQRKIATIEPDQELYREYLLTVREGTDEVNQRRKRERILRGVLAPLFEVKDAARVFSAEQRRIIWNSTAIRKCVVCNKTLTWDDFTIDHIHPYSLGGETELDNAELMCRKHNSSKNNRIDARKPAQKRRQSTSTISMQT